MRANSSPSSPARRAACCGSGVAQDSIRAGIVAGGPFACAESAAGRLVPYWPTAMVQNAQKALHGCMLVDWGTPDPVELADRAKELSGAGQIDSLADLAADGAKGVLQVAAGGDERRGAAAERREPLEEAAVHGGVDAEEFCQRLLQDGVVADAVLFDPPYSPRQISECYKSIGKAVSMRDTQNALLYSRVRKPLAMLLRPGGVALSFGWQSSGFGKDWTTEEILLVQHGGAHNDTVCVAQRKPL